MNKKLIGIVTGLIIATSVIYSIEMALSIPAYAEDDESDERESDERESDERESDERESDEREEGEGLGAGTSDLVLYVVAAAIISSIGYAGYKLLKAKKPTSK